MGSGTRSVTRPVVRLATRADVSGLMDLYASLSPRSTQMRFSSALPAPVLARTAALDGAREALAVVAVVEGRVVAEARLAGDAACPELGVTVADDHQRQGLGRLLVDRLRVEAARRGTRTFRAQVRVDNQPMLHLLQTVGAAIVRPAVDGDVEVELSCDDRMPGWTGGLGRRVLVESGSLWEDPVTARLRAAGYAVRQCLGPRRGAAQTCPLVTEGRCRLVEEADLVACLLPDGDPSCHEVVEAHAARRDGRPLIRSMAEWRVAAARMTAPRPSNLPPGVSERSRGVP